MNIVLHGDVVKKFVNQKVNLNIFSFDVRSGFVGEFYFNQPGIFASRKFEAINIELIVDRKIQYYTLSQSSILVIPAGCKLKIYSQNANSAFTILGPTLKLYRRVLDNCALEKKKFDDLFAAVKLLERKNWMNEILLRYVYEMVETKNRTNYVIKFLELEIMKELYFNHLEQTKGKNKFQFAPSLHSIANDSLILQKAIIYIDNNLLKGLTIKKLFQGIGTSESTLLRAFKKALNQTPQKYIIERKLQEARFLIRSKRYNVSETAFLLGYASVSAFSGAFKKYFKVGPSEISEDF